MKLVLFADLHLAAPFAWLGGSQLAARRRRQALREALCRVTRLAAVIRADALLCAGDLYEQARYTPDRMALLVQAFEEIEPLPVSLAPGIHDLLLRVALADHLTRSGEVCPLILDDPTRTSTRRGPRRCSTWSIRSPRRAR